MAGILRKNQLIFGGSLSPAANLSIWGSLAAGNVQYSNDPEAIQSPAWLQGFDAALVGNKSPSFQDLNAALYEITYQLQYILTRGLPEYNSEATYNTNDICRVGAAIYSSLVDGNIGNAPPSAQWTNFFSAVKSPSFCLAWVVFSGLGSSPTVFNAFNVSGVTKLGTGSYQVQFATPLPSNNYAFAGSAGTPNGQSPSPGDNNVIVGGPSGASIVRNENECNVYCRETTQSPGLEDSSCISVMFFGS